MKTIIITLTIPENKDEQVAIIKKPIYYNSDRSETSKFFDLCKTLTQDELITVVKHLQGYQGTCMFNIKTHDK